MMGAAKLAVKRRIVDEPRESFPIFAAVVWECVMWLFRHNKDVLQSGLQASMQYIYADR